MRLVKPAAGSSRRVLTSGHAAGKAKYFAALLVFSLLLAGCANLPGKDSNKYLCSDGREVSNPSGCTNAGASPEGGAGLPSPQGNATASPAAENSANKQADYSSLLLSPDETGLREKTYSEVYQQAASPLLLAAAVSAGTPQDKKLRDDVLAFANNSKFTAGFYELLDDSDPNAYSTGKRTLLQYVEAYERLESAKALFGALRTNFDKNVAPGVKTSALTLDATADDYFARKIITQSSPGTTAVAYQLLFLKGGIIEYLFYQGAQSDVDDAGALKLMNAAAAKKASENRHYSEELRYITLADGDAGLLLGERTASFSAGIRSYSAKLTSRDKAKGIIQTITVYESAKKAGQTIADLKKLDETRGAYDNKTTVESADVGDSGFIEKYVTSDGHPTITIRFSKSNKGEELFFTGFTDGEALATARKAAEKILIPI